jgi:hypothetical protein
MSVALKHQGNFRRSALPRIVDRKESVMEKSIAGFFVYSYHHDDDGAGWQPLTDPETITTLTSLFKECGWEGDGKLEWMLVPPFFGDSTWNHWFRIYHVKQSNNGTSWIASKHRLTVEDLNAVTASTAKAGR